VTADHDWTENDLPEALRRALALALEKGARQPVVLRLTELAGYTDWALIVSGRSDRNVQGITEGIVVGLKSEGVKPMGTDGLGQHTWDLLDFDEFLVHVFYHPVREFYDLESMWNDAPRVKLDLPDEVMDTSDLAGLAAPDPMPGWRGGSEFGGFEDEFEDDDEELFETR
jgi:ribosome-associated protein